VSDAATSRSPRILVVEDDEAHAELIVAGFESAGEHALDVVGSVAEALEHLASATPDLLLVDFLLPDGRGTELIGHPAGHPPVILMTSQGDEALAVEALKAGALDYVVKSAESLMDMPRIAQRALREWALVEARRLAEQRLRQSEQLLRLALEGAQAGAWQWDLSNDQVVWTDETHALFGLEPGSFGGTIDDLYVLVHPDDRASLQADLSAVMDQDDPFVVEFRIAQPDGAIRWIEGRGQVCRVSGCHQLVGIARDITSHKEAEAERTRLEAELRQAQRMESVGKLAGGISHDFNNLLQAILGNVSLALRALPADHAAKEDLVQVELAALRAAELTRQLLAFSRRDELAAVSLDLNELVSNLLRMLPRLLPEQIKIAFEPSESLGPVLGDASQLEQVLINLCINARDAMPDGGLLTIQTRQVEFGAGPRPAAARQDRYTLLSVSDSGAGIDPEHLERIFEPFFTTKAPGKGTGLGLSLVYGTVKQHGGWVEVVSHPRQGTTFLVHLPCPSEAPPTRPEARERDDEIPRGSETLLAAADEPFVLRLVTRILEGAGYRVLPARDGQEALRLFEEHSDEVSLLLLDAIMPHLSGRAVFERIRASNPDVPIVFTSGYAEDMLPLSFLAESGLELIHKPYDTSDLLRTLRRVLDPEPGSLEAQ